MINVEGEQIEVVDAHSHMGARKNSPSIRFRRL